MNALFYIVSATANIILECLIIAILVRVVMSLLVDGDSPVSKVYIFCCAVTEPVVAPTRKLLDKVPALQNSPLDLSYVATSFILIVIQAALQAS